MNARRGIIGFALAAVIGLIGLAFRTEHPNWSGASPATSCCSRPRASSRSNEKEPTGGRVEPVTPGSGDPEPTRRTTVAEMAASGRAIAERQMVVVTPTYAPDLELFSDLHESVLRWFPADVRHVAVVTERNVAPFRRFEGPRCIVIGIDDVLPRSVRALPRIQMRINLRQPVPPLRGWILQQLVKLAIAEQAQERVVIMADSDVVFVRPVTVDTFAPGGRLRLYRKEDGVEGSMSRHMRWHVAARTLLGLSAAEAPPLPDYVSGLNGWDRDVIKRMLRRVESVTGRRWLEAVGRELHFSEQILYGVYADEVEQSSQLTPTGDSLCHEYYSNMPLTAERAPEWLSSLGPHDVAYMISSKSHTPLSVRRAAHASVFAD
jgi:Family of unknown function (DUF6492)